MKEKRFWCMLGDMPIEIEAKYAYTQQLFEDYRIIPSQAQQMRYRNWRIQAGADGALPFRVSRAETDRERLAEEDAPEEYLESIALYRKLCEALLTEDILLFHCSALCMDGKAYLFTAPSGTGKSTHTRLWRETFGSRVTMINDDKPLLRFSRDGKILVYGTPYGGKEQIQTNMSAEAAGIVILHRAKENTIRRLTEREAYPALFQQTYRNLSDAQAMRRTMELVAKLAELPVFSMGCTISQEAARMSCEMLKGATKI